MSDVGRFSERLHGFDALRGGLLLLGVVQHSTGPFVPLEQYWVLEDVNQNIAIGTLSFVIHVFRMTAFFALAGFFARMSVHRLGTPRFAQDRFRRVFLPFVVGWFAIIPLTLLISTWTLVESYGPEGLRSHLAPPASINANNIPLQHLWFLYVLSLIYAGVVVGRWLMRLVDPNCRLSNFAHRIARPILGNPLGILCLALPATIVMGTVPNWTTSVGPPTPNGGLFYVARSVLVYGAAFAAGWAMHRQLDLWPRWAQWWPWMLAVALAFTLASLVFSAAYPLGTQVPVRLLSIAQAATYSIASWTWTFALVGLVLRFLSGPSRARRYLADASYWIYLVHPPLLLLIGSAIRDLDWPAWIKLSFTVGTATAILLVSYQLFVRYSFIGAVLNGKRQKFDKLTVKPA